MSGHTADSVQERVFLEICDELGCAYDNEAALTAIASLKQAVAAAKRSRCPVCGSNLEQETDDDGHLLFFCVNDGCPSNNPSAPVSVREAQVCAGGIDPGFDECPKCGASMDDECRGAPADSHAELVKALEEILSAEKEFREGMPDGWEGDPLTDACANADAALAKATPSRNQVADISQRRVTKPCGHRDCEFPKCDCEEAST